MLISEKQHVKYTFSGHETFQCRHLWLKKGYDFVVAGKSFNSEDAGVELGVGKNMVSSIRFWMRAFNIIDNNDKPTAFANRLLMEGGWDPYLEDEATLWLLHYHLIKKGLASTYHLIFNEFRREKIEFTKENFVSFVKRKAEGIGFQANDKTLREDFGVMVKMYIRSDSQSKDIEDTFSGLLTELDLVENYKRKDIDNKVVEYYEIVNNEREELPAEVLLYSILDFGQFDSSISLLTIEQEPNSGGMVFAINRTGIVNKIETMIGKYKNITFNDHAGVKELQFKEKYEPFKILEDYYAK